MAGLAVLSALPAMAGSAPPVTLKLVSGEEVAQAKVEVRGSDCHMKLHTGKLAPGRYKPVLIRAAKCFAHPANPPVIAESEILVVDADGMMKAVMRFSGVAENGNAEKMLRTRDVLLMLTPENGSSSAACGAVTPWFSPWRDSRR
ncbi:MAG: hypothetical protein KGN84_13415 [Acidobacteriota bacterium]|nr:hypothetical protein [Acidobacteriota bacterium]